MGSMTFKDGDKVVSPWHDMPLELEGGLYNMLTEIPKMTFKKMEVDTKSPGNPIKQDEKKGKARLYHGPIFWNYGCLPRTWEDPGTKGNDDVGGAFGDDDPVDVVEIGAASLAMGSFPPVNGFGHGERALNAAETKEVIAETNGFYKKLISGETDAGKLWVPSKACITSELLSHV